MKRYITTCTLSLLVALLKAQCYLPPHATDRGFIGYPPQREIWKSQVIPYAFQANFPGSRQDTILKALATIQANTNICFIPWKNEARKMLIKPFNNTLYSYADLNEQSINLSSYDQSVVIHEVCHLLGMAHEHQRPDRGQKVAVFYNNIIPGFEPAFDIIPPDSSMLMPPEYDSKSIMQYPSWAFSKNGLPTITDIGWNQIPFNTELSAGDIAILNEAYPLKIDCAKAAEERPPQAGIQEESGIICTYTLHPFKSVSAAAASYKWSAPGAAPASGTDSVFTVYFLQPGDYTVSLEASNAFGTDTMTISIQAGDCIAPAIVSVTPNPAVDQLHITLSRMIPPAFRLRLFAMNGQLLADERLGTPSLGSTEYTYPLPFLPQGLYLLSLEVYDTVLTYPFFAASR